MRRRLPYLADLGVGALWLSPVLKNCQWKADSYHGYGIQDFLRVEPRFTSDPAAARIDPRIGDDELRRLVDAAHAHGLHVILDVVINHAGDVFDYVSHGAEAPWKGGGREYDVRWRDATGQRRAGVAGGRDDPGAPSTRRRRVAGGAPAQRLLAPARARGEGRAGDRAATSGRSRRSSPSTGRTAGSRCASS